MTAHHITHGYATIEKQQHPPVHATEEQEAYLRAVYGTKPLQLIAADMGLSMHDASLFVHRLRVRKVLPPGPGKGWRTVWAARGFPVPPLRLAHAGNGPTQTERPSQPRCPDGQGHIRLCGDLLIQRHIPDFFDTHPPTPLGSETQVCRRCLDVLVVRVGAWAKGADEDVA